MENFVKDASLLFNKAKKKIIVGVENIKDSTGISDGSLNPLYDEITDDYNKLSKKIDRLTEQMNLMKLSMKRSSQNATIVLYNFKRAFDRTDQVKFEAASRLHDSLSSFERECEELTDKKMKMHIFEKINELKDISNTCNYLKMNTRKHFLLLRQFDSELVAAQKRGAPNSEIDSILATRDHHDDKYKIKIQAYQAVLQNLQSKFLEANKNFLDFFQSMQTSFYMGLSQCFSDLDVVNPDTYLLEHVNLQTNNSYSRVIPDVPGMTDVPTFAH